MPKFDVKHNRGDPTCVGCAPDLKTSANTASAEPLAPLNKGESGEMNCAAIAWALAQDVYSASAGRLLIEIARRSIGGHCVSTQIDLGLACKLSERQTRTLLASLTADGFVKRTRQGGAGKGRAPDRYELLGYVEAACEQPAIFAGSHDATGSERQIEVTGNGQSSPEAALATGSFDRQSSPDEATGNSAPTPPIRTTTTVEDNPSPSEPSFEGGVGGELFTPTEAPPAKAKTGTKRRPRRTKFYATEETMPLEPNEAMREYAMGKHMFNGNLAEQFGKFRRYHIRERSLIASLEQRWETWADNWGDRNPKRPDGAAPKGFKSLGVGPDGKERWARNHRQNVYR